MKTLPLKYLSFQEFPAILTIIVYHEFEAPGSLFTCAEFMNDKILKRNARQMRSIWILELLYRIK